MHPDNVHTIYLLDTPGFDDTNRSDIDILTHIAHYLSVSYANNITVSGIIFLHSIADNRVSGSKMRNITMFKELVGDAAYENVAITTTMWWKGEKEANIRKEGQLREEFFKDVLEGGGNVFRHTAGAGPEDHDRARQQAMEVVSHLMERARVGPVVLKIQGELIDERKSLNQTRAGEALREEGEKMQRELKTQLEEMNAERKEALQRRDIVVAQTLQETENETNKKRELIVRSQAELRKTLPEMYAKEEERLMDRIREMEHHWSESMQKKEQELKAIEEKSRESQIAAEREAERLRRQQAEIARSRAAEREWDARRKAEAERQRRREWEKYREAEDLRRRQEQDAQRMAMELAYLRQSIETKQQATAKVKEGYGSALAKGLASGLTSGVVGFGKKLLDSYGRDVC